MSRNPLFDQLSRTMRVAWFAERTRIATGEALERAAEAGWNANKERSRREFLGDVARLASGALATVARPLDLAGAAQTHDGHSVAIVGAGMAGLACADRLRASGLLATVYEAASERVGGRVRSISDTFPGRTIEHGSA
jgi:NADPH-dependent 2,4-dienoyl-CoA reductase/sulfur reductase-like enzyme